MNVEEREPYPEAIIINQKGIQLTVRCPHCKQKHFHGTGGIEFNNNADFGTRIPHCNDLGLKKTGIPKTVNLCEYKVVRK